MGRNDPVALWLVRHAESMGNVARGVAESGGAEMIDLAEHDADVPRSGRGREQARALATWFAGLPADERPTVAVSSPYRRALDTAREVLSGSGPVPLRVDERLRDRELGVLDLHTKAGIEARHPGEAARRRRLGKLYYRPPGGGSWPASRCGCAPCSATRPSISRANASCGSPTRRRSCSDPVGPLHH